MKKFVKFFFILLLVVVILFAVLYFSFNYLTSPVDKEYIGAGYSLKIVQGASVKSVAIELQENNIIRNATAMYLLARKNNIVIKSGRYETSKNMSCSQILETLQSGKQSSVVVSIPEGLTISKVADILQKNEVTNAQDFINQCKNPQILSFYNIPSENLEGYLFPDTYYFDYEMDAKKVIQIMVDNFYSKIITIPELINISPEELHKKVVLASIVEREYRIASEAPLIASVFTNRLKRNIGLYSCATVEYIITEIQGLPHPEVITYEDLKIDNPYNTYKWAGLPPGAISNPGIIALSSAANPPKTQYYFFRLQDAQKGNHVFTKDFESHTEQGKTFSTKKNQGQ